MSKPVAVPKELLCSECGLDWDLHPENPRRRDCIELLKQEARRPAPIWHWHYCNWGHANCYISHNYGWGTTQTIDATDWDTTAITLSGSTVDSSNVSYITFNGPDDPDMGVSAQVS